MEVPGVQRGEEAAIVMRAFDGDTWESSLCRGKSAPISVTLGGGPDIGKDLFGLQAFTVDCIPEPRTLCLIVAMGTLWGASRIGSSSKKIMGAPGRNTGYPDLFVVPYRAPGGLAVGV